MPNKLHPDFICWLGTWCACLNFENVRIKSEDSHMYTLLPFTSLSRCKFRVRRSTSRLRLLICSTWETQTCYCLFVMTTTLFYSMAHTANKSEFSFFSLINTLLVSCWLSLWLRPLNYWLYHRRPRFLSMWVWMCLRASIYIYVQVGVGLKIKSADPQSALFPLSFMFFFPSK